MAPGKLAEILKFLNIPFSGQSADQSNIRIAGGSTTFWAEGLVWTPVDPKCDVTGTTNTCAWRVSGVSAPSVIYYHVAKQWEKEFYIPSIKGASSWEIDTAEYQADGGTPGGQPVTSAFFCSSSDGSTCGNVGSYVLVKPGSLSTASFFQKDLPPTADGASTSHGKRFHDTNCKNQNGAFCDHLECVQIKINGNVQPNNGVNGCPSGFFPCPGGHCIVGIQ